MKIASLIILTLLPVAFAQDTLTSASSSSEENVRVKRAGFSLITGAIQNLQKNAFGASASLSAGSSSQSSGSSSFPSKPSNDVHSHTYSHDEYEEPQHDTKSFDGWQLKKSILNTLLQAVKAIAGGVTTLKGQLIKGSGYLVSQKGKLISSGGDAVSNAGKNIINSAHLIKPESSSGGGHGQSFGKVLGSTFGGLTKSISSLSSGSSGQIASLSSSSSGHSSGGSSGGSGSSNSDAYGAVDGPNHSYNIPESNDYNSFDQKPAVILSSYGPPKPTISYIHDPHQMYASPEYNDGSHKSSSNQEAQDVLSQILQNLPHKPMKSVGYELVSDGDGFKQIPIPDDDGLPPFKPLKNHQSQNNPFENFPSPLSQFGQDFNNFPSNGDSFGHANPPNSDFGPTFENHPSSLAPNSQFGNFEQSPPHDSPFQLSQEPGSDFGLSLNHPDSNRPSLVSGLPNLSPFLIRQLSSQFPPSPPSRGNNNPSSDFDFNFDNRRSSKPTSSRFVSNSKNSPSKGDQSDKPNLDFELNFDRPSSKKPNSNLGLNNLPVDLIKPSNGDDDESFESSQEPGSDFGLSLDRPSLKKPNSNFGGLNNLPADLIKQLSSQFPPSPNTGNNEPSRGTRKPSSGLNINVNLSPTRPSDGSFRQPNSDFGQNFDRPSSKKPNSNFDLNFRSQPSTKSPQSGSNLKNSPNEDPFPFQFERPTKENSKFDVNDLPLDLIKQISSQFPQSTNNQHSNPFGSSQQPNIDFNLNISPSRNNPSDGSNPPTHSEANKPLSSQSPPSNIHPSHDISFANSQASNPDFNLDINFPSHQNPSPQMSNSDFVPASHSSHSEYGPATSHEYSGQSSNVKPTAVNPKAYDIYHSMKLKMTKKKNFVTVPTIIDNIRGLEIQKSIRYEFQA